MDDDPVGCPGLIDDAESYATANANANANANPLVRRAWSLVHAIVAPDRVAYTPHKGRHATHGGATTVADPDRA